MNPRWNAPLKGKPRAVIGARLAKVNYCPERCSINANPRPGIDVVIRFLLFYVEESIVIVGFHVYFGVFRLLSLCLSVLFTLINAM